IGMFSRLKVSWNHFGQKHSLRISDYELEHTNLYDALMKKVHEIRPDFEGAIAYIDQYGREVIVNNDKDLRVAIDQSKEKLKLHTALTYGQVISAAELAGKPVRSHSVPPSMDRGYHSYPPGNSRPPSSMESAPTIRKWNISPPPALSISPRKQHKMSHGSFTCGTGITLVKVEFRSKCRHPASMHLFDFPSDGRDVVYPGYGYKYNSYAPYSQNLVFGMPTHNAVLLSPFPFGGHYRTSFIGPNKYHHFGGWSGHKYYSPGWGPVW
ncbi:hypothetical protein GCK32_009897, partial [Trichostrongylus colubriformis]